MEKWFNSSLSHSEDRRFEPGWKHSFFWTPDFFKAEIYVCIPAINSELFAIFQSSSVN